MPAVALQVYGNPPWLQPTYNLESQLAPMIGDYMLRQKAAESGRKDLEAAESNLWILKPWNMARSLDSSVASSLPQIVRMIETGPKIAQKYIERPALFRGKKFDLRFLVLVRSFKPMEAFVHKVFWVRLPLLSPPSAPVCKHARWHTCWVPPGR